MQKSKKEKAWEQFSRFIRIRDAIKTTGTITHARCITCGVVLPIVEMDAGHAIKGRHNSILFLEELCHAQCVNCNRYSDGKYDEFKYILVDIHGQEKWEEWEALKRKSVKYTDSDYENLRVTYRNKAEALKKTV